MVEFLAVLCLALLVVVCVLGRTMNNDDEERWPQWISGRFGRFGRWRFGIRVEAKTWEAARDRLQALGLRP